MIQNAALDVAIGLILMYLMLSLLCTTVNEYIASKLNLRAASLASALQEILDDKDVLERFYNNSLIAGPTNAVAKADNLLKHLTMKLGDLPAAVFAAPPGATVAERVPVAAPEGAAVAAGTAITMVAPPKDHPSYISSMNFATAVLGALDPAKPIPALKDVQDAVDALPAGSKLKAALQGALTSSSANIDQVRRSLANWFDDSMERLSGAYKRHLKLISVIVGLVIAGAFNADSLEVARRLWTDSDSRALVAGIATKATDNTFDNLAKETTVAEDIRPLPIGWGCGKVGNDAVRFHCKSPELSWSWIGDLLSKLLGLALTASALTLGAPFWFDLLQKFVNIRGTGIKPNRADAK
jgi:hypothetical protein